MALSSSQGASAYNIPASSKKKDLGKKKKKNKVGSAILKSFKKI